VFHRRETGDEPGIVVAEVPAKTAVVFSFAKSFSVGRKQSSLFHIRVVKTLKASQREDQAVVFPDCNSPLEIGNWQIFAGS